MAVEKVYISDSVYQVAYNLRGGGYYGFNKLKIDDYRK